MNLNYEKNIILNVLDKKPNLGKTSVMKIVYMLQQVKSLNLVYDFTIYTYGPYCSDVTEDLDDLVSKGFITASMYPSHNYIGYELSIAEKVKENINKLEIDEEDALDDILDFAKDKSAKDLELCSTIIYVDNLYTKNNWDKTNKAIVNKVREIKPHFSEEIIESVYSSLLERKYISF